MTVTTPFMSADDLDQQLRALSPNDAAAFIAERMVQLRIKLVTGHGYLKSEDSAVCAIGSLITLLAGQAPDLFGIDLTLDDGLLLREIEGEVDDAIYGTEGYYDRHVDGIRVQSYPYHTWLMDNTKMTFGEVKSLENGFENQGYDPNPAGLSNESDNGEVRHFYDIGVELRHRHSISSVDLEYEDEDYEEEDYEEEDYEEEDYEEDSAEEEGNGW